MWMSLIKLARIVSPLTTILFVIGWTMVAADGQRDFDIFIDIPLLGIPTGLAIQAVAIIMAGVAGSRHTDGGMGFFMAINAVVISLLGVFIVGPSLIANLMTPWSNPMGLSLSLVTLLAMLFFSVRGIEDIYRAFIPKPVVGML